MSQISNTAIFARSAGYSNTPIPRYRTSCVIELPLTLVSGSRTLLALDSEGVAVATGILEPGGDMDGLASDLHALLELLDTGPARSVLQLVP